MAAWLWRRRAAPPSAEDAARRLLILKVQVVHGLAAPPPEVLSALRGKWTAEEWAGFEAKAAEQCAAMAGGLRRAGLWQLMEAGERAFIQATPSRMTEQQRVDASWLAEAAVALMWALGLLDALPPWDVETGPEPLKQVPGDTAGFLRAARLRPAEELEEARALAELWHWRSRTRQLQEQGFVPAPPAPPLEQIVAMAAEAAAERGDLTPIGGDFPACGKPYAAAAPEEWQRLTSIAVERHRALNWVCGRAPGNQWGQTPTDT